MNHIYLSIWNAALGAWIAVSEISKGQSKRSVRKQTICVVSLLTCTFSVWALPTGNELVAGQASVSTSTATQMQIQQASQKAVINWQNFSVGQQESVNIQQPNVQAALLNRVVGQDASQIQGKINANGQVYLVNPNGVIFSKTAQVDVGGLVATTHDISNQDFMNGKHHFSQNGATGKIENHGTIKAAEHGVVALISEQVSNTGTIETPQGTTVLAAGKTVDLDFQGDGLVEVKVSEAALNAQINNQGAIQADGGRVVMTAKAANALMDTVINQQGIIKAQGLIERNGEIILDGGDNGTVKVSGNLDTTNSTQTASTSQPITGGINIQGNTISLENTARLNTSGTQHSSNILIGDKQHTTQVSLAEGSTLNANVSENGTAGKVEVFANMDKGQVTVQGTINAQATQQGTGGFIETSAAKVKIADTANISTKATQGQSGTWLIDPTDFTIAATGGDITGATLSANLNGGNVTIFSTSGATGVNGDVNVNDVVSWSANTLTLNAQRNININADMNGSGTAKLALLYGQSSFNGGANDNYFINFTNGVKISLPTGLNFSTQKGTNVANLKNYTVITSLGAQGSTTTTDLQGMNGNVAGLYALGADIDASVTSTWNTGAGFEPIGLITTPFSGSFEGLGHTISGLTINRPVNGVGLFGYSSAPSRISNVGVINNKIIGQVNVGGLVGLNLGTINNSYATGTISGTALTIGTGTGIGGLVGYNGGIISGSYATGTVTGSGFFADSFGGLVGFSNGGQIRDSYSIATVTAIGNNTNVGGLVGGIINGGLVSGSYSSGTVNSTGNNLVWIGGLIGGIDIGGTVQDSYSTSTVNSVGDNNSIGGLIGYSDANVTNTYATGAVNTSGTANQVGGLIGTKTSPSVVNVSFWDTSSTGQISSAAGTPLNSTQIKQLATYSSWNINDIGSSPTIWRIYNGYTAPLLRYWLTPLTITTSNISKTYNGLADSSLIASYSIPNAPTSGRLFNIADPYNGAKNVGIYNVVNLPYSNQQGYDISLINGVLTILPAVLSVTPMPNQTIIYGTAPAAFSPSITGFVNGEDFSSAGIVGSSLFNINGFTGDVGSYDVNYAGGLTSQNYIFADNAASINELTVSPATLFVTPSFQNIFFGSNLAPFFPIFTGFVNGDTLLTAGITGIANFNIFNFTGAVGSYNVSYLNGLSSKNYVFADNPLSINELFVIQTPAPVVTPPSIDAEVFESQTTPLQTATVYTFQTEKKLDDETESLVYIENGGVKIPSKLHQVIKLFLSCKN